MEKTPKDSEDSREHMTSVLGSSGKTEECGVNSPALVTSRDHHWLLEAAASRDQIQAQLAITPALCSLCDSSVPLLPYP